MSPPIGPGDVFAGEYRVGELLGSGGMGAVYVAEQLSTGKLRALKLMHPQLLLDVDLRSRFEREARTSSAIESEHVAEVVGAGVDEERGVPWIAMELLDGEDLEAFVRRRGALDLGETLEVMRQICHALGQAHAIGIIHRDLKPENVFVARTRGARDATTIKLLDFGVAKVMAGTEHATATLGTPLWMSPEQSDPDARINPAADVWSLGLLAFWLLTGKYYWASANKKGVSVQALMREILFEPLPTASERAGALPGALPFPAELDVWFARCLSREASDRFADAADLFTSLAAALPNTSGAALVLPAKTAKASSLVPRPRDRSRGKPTPTGLSLDTPRPERRWLLPMVAGLVGSLLLSGLVLAFSLGWLRFGPPEEAAQPTSTAAAPIEPSATLAQLPAPTATATASPPVPITSGPLASASASATGAAKPSRPRRVFDEAEARRRLSFVNGHARVSCRERSGPRAIGLSVTYDRGGFPSRVTFLDPAQGGSASAGCARMLVYGTKVAPFDTPESGTVTTVVSLD